LRNIFEFAAFCLHGENGADKVDIDARLDKTHQALRLCKMGDLDYQSIHAPLPVSATVFPARPELLDPRKMPRRKFTTLKGQIAFFHALAHIEFMAIYLAWDMIYRFRGMPDPFYQDWLQVADEEAIHFAMLRNHLQNLGSDYGDLPAHSGLWDVAVDTADDVLARLALVPRFMEAHGLDVSGAMIEKFKALGDNKSVQILTRILNDEVGHVGRGSFWFNSVCTQRGYDSESMYRQLVVDRLKGNPHGKLNRELRKKAGFSDSELDWLASF
jgi:uncharacterized ferritin-like protein (DUF455 family)